MVVGNLLWAHVQALTNSHAHRRIHVHISSRNSSSRRWITHRDRVHAGTSSEHKLFIFLLIDGRRKVFHRGHLVFLALHPELMNEWRPRAPSKGWRQLLRISENLPRVFPLLHQNDWTLFRERVGAGQGISLEVRRTEGKWWSDVARPIGRLPSCPLALVTCVVQHNRKWGQLSSQSASSDPPQETHHVSNVVKYVDVVMVFRHSSPEIVLAQLILFSFIFYGASIRSLSLSLSPAILSIPKHTKVGEASNWTVLTYRLSKVFPMPLWTFNATSS